ncbi:MAG: hypothetical protein KDE25_00495 [Novosphingobium sp.]|nr:hypothetical protein [Novosphingobium sp.]
MLKFIMTALAVAYPWDPSFDDLSYALPDPQNECRAKFPKGEFEFGFAEIAGEGRAAPIVIVTGLVNKPLRVGQRLYVSSYSPIYHRALVIKAEGNSATVVVGNSLAGDTITNGTSFVLNLHEQPSDVGSLRYTMMHFDEGPSDRKEVALAQALECFHSSVDHE